MKKDEKCFYCEGTGKIQYRDNPEVRVCSVCNGSGKNYKAIYQKRFTYKSKCKYCGRPCSGYACESCLNLFKNDKGSEEE